MTWRQASITSLTLVPRPVPRLQRNSVPRPSFSRAEMWAEARSSTWM
nr:hypothetical protein [Planctomyces sp. SH-PL62]